METGQMLALYKATVFPISIFLSVMDNLRKYDRHKLGFLCPVSCLVCGSSLLLVTLTAHCHACRALWAACLWPLGLCL